MDTNNWDFLAFCGSIIGGAITWFGVKITLKHQEKALFNDSFNKQMGVLHKTLRGLITVKQLQTFIVTKDIKDASRLSELENRIGILKSFYTDLKSEYFDLMLGIVDWKVLQSIEEKSEKMIKLMIADKLFENTYAQIRNPSIDLNLPEGFKTNVDRNISSLNELFHEMNEIAMSIYKDLESHKLDLIKRNQSQ